MPMRKTAILMTFFLALLCLPMSGQAQEQGQAAPPVSGADDHKGFSVYGGVGLMASPTSFLMQFGLPYDFGNGFALGPQVQVGISDVTTTVGAVLDARYTIRIRSSDDVVSRLQPFVNGGFGVAYVKHEVGQFEWDGTDFLMELGFGLGYRLSEEISLESGMQFNIIPGSAAGEKFYYSWQMAGIRYKF